MKQSKLDFYIETLETLNQPLSQNLTNFSCKIKIDCNTLENHMNFLMKQNLVPKRNSGDKIFYTNTEREKNILRYFNELDNSAFVEDSGIEIS